MSLVWFQISFQEKSMLFSLGFDSSFCIKRNFRQSSRRTQPHHRCRKGHTSRIEQKIINKKHQWKLYIYMTSFFVWLAWNQQSSSQQSVAAAAVWWCNPSNHDHNGVLKSCISAFFRESTETSSSSSSSKSFHMGSVLHRASSGQGNRS